MTIDEAKDICSKMSDLNFKIWFADGNEKTQLISQFRDCARRVCDAGFKIRRKKCAGRAPLFMPRVPRHVDLVDIRSNRPAGLDVKGDCTTRCISFCTGIDYSTIKSEQLANASKAGHGWTWKHQRIWSQSLVSRGFSRITLTGRRISRSTFLRYAKKFHINSGIIATMSSNHVAAIDMASRKILDTWNSTGGWIENIYVPSAQVNEYIKWLQSMDVPCIKLDASPVC